MAHAAKPLWLVVWELYMGDCRYNTRCVAEAVYGEANRTTVQRVHSLLSYARRRLRDDTNPKHLCLARAQAHVETLRQSGHYVHARVMVEDIVEKKKSARNKRERQYYEHEELLYWLYSNVLGLQPNMYVWAFIISMHCVLFPALYGTYDLRVWRTGRKRWPPFNATCDSWNYAFYVLDAGLLSYGMYSQRAQLNVVRPKLTACKNNTSLYGFIVYSVLNRTIQGGEAWASRR